MGLVANFIVVVILVTTGPALGHRHGKAHRVDSAASEDSDGKIVGGYNTTIQNIPYQVYLLLQKGNEYFQCGGTIISKRYVLTAAHCVQGIQKIYARIGSADSQTGGTRYTTSTYRAHPLYNPKTIDYDVAVIRMNQDMKLDGKTTKAINLPRQNAAVNPNTTVLVSGWGDTTENGNVSRTLMAVQLMTVATDQCNKSYNNGITARMLCAGVPEGGKGSCQGDSGGPAVSNNTQLGIVSFGVGCARAGYPSVFSKVSALRNWIKLNSGV